MPGTKNVGQNIRELHKVKEHPSQSSVPSVAAHRSNKQIVAIAESQARAARGKESAHAHHTHAGFHGKE